jgi:hypothetical protein
MAQKYIMYLLPHSNFGDAVTGGQNLPMQLHRPIFAFGHLHSLRVGWRNFFPVVLLSQFLILPGNRFWFYILTFLEYNTVVALC